MGVNALVPLSAAVVYICLLVLIILNRPWQKQHKFFTLYLLAATLWSFSTFLNRSDLLVENKLVLFRIAIAASIWWIVQLYYFIRVFLDLPVGIWIWVGYSSLAASVILAAFGYWPLSLTFDNGVITPDWGWYVFLYAITMQLFAVLGFYFVVRRFRTLVDVEERNKFAYLIVAMSLLTVFGTIGMTHLADKFPYSHLGGLLSVCIFSYAILRHELVNINSMLRRTLGWASLFVVGTGSYALLLYLLHFIFKFDLQPVTLVAATVVAATASWFIYKLRHVFLDMVDQLFYRGTYSYRQALLSFNIKMGNIINLDELAGALLPTICKALHTSRVQLLFEDSRSGDFTTQYSYPELDVEKSYNPEFDYDSPIIKWLEKDSGPLDLKQLEFIPQLKSLWEAEKEKVAAFDLECLYPIKSRGKLIGILALSRRLTNTAYSQEDIQMIISMASQAGILIENARMFDTLKKQQIQMQQILAQSVVAQEEERQRISIDLHDSVAQWLAGASYRVQTADALITRDGGKEARAELVTVENTIVKSLKELRRVVIGLRPPALDELGLNHALKQSLEELKSDGLICRFTEAGTRTRLPSSVEIAVYRLVQEGLSNIRKHANATRVSLKLQFRDDSLVVEVHDNGKGFDLSKTLDSAIAVGHMGLLGMKQRAEMLGGDIKIKTGAGAGTTLSLTLPIRLEDEEV